VKRVVRHEQQGNNERRCTCGAHFSTPRELRRHVKVITKRETKGKATS